jgi:hypothetical protein
MLAAANGLAGTETLVEGQSLVVPDQPANFRNNAGTFRPYDAASAIGDTQPGASKVPKRGNKCGVFGQILLAAIAIAVTVATAGSGAPFLAQVGAAMLGSAVSQSVGVITGIQSKFSFKSVALAGITAGVTQGLSPGGLFKNGLNAFGTAAGSAARQTITGIANAAVRGAVASALTQGIGKATGLSNQFSWTGVGNSGDTEFRGQNFGDTKFRGHNT